MDHTLQSVGFTLSQTQGKPVACVKVLRGRNRVSPQRGVVIRNWEFRLRSLLRRMLADDQFRKWGCGAGTYIIGWGTYIMPGGGIA